jgi:hypothetical protein
MFYAARVVSKESRRLVLPRTSCFKITEVGLKKKLGMKISLTSKISAAILVQVKSLGFAGFLPI